MVSFNSFKLPSEFNEEKALANSFNTLLLSLNDSHASFKSSLMKEKSSLSKKTFRVLFIIEIMFLLYLENKLIKISRNLTVFL